MPRNITMAAMGVVLGLAVCMGGAIGEESRPNVVFILADDLGYGDLHCYGRPDIRTPTLDRLAAQGVRFTHCYANGPECTPTRAAWMTGRYPQRVGGLECAIGSGNVGRYDDAIRLRGQDDLGLPVEETTVARWLREAGYATALCGKWHLGYEPKFSPNRHGFEHAFYCIGGGMDYFHHTEPEGLPALYLNGEPIRREGYFTDLVADEALRVIDRCAERPCFLYVAFTAPHSPFQGPQDAGTAPLAADSPRWDQGKAAPDVYTAMIEHLDLSIGRILAALDRRNLADKTVVVFTSDNGGTASGRNAPLSGNKGSTFEGGIRVPAIVRWPQRIPAGLVSEQVCITMDFTASIARIAGATVPAGRRLDGIDVLARVEAREMPTPRTLFWRKKRGDQTWWAVRDGSVKYVRRAQGSQITEYLFDLSADPAEKDDLAAKQPEQRERLKKQLADWEREVRPTR